MSYVKHYSDRLYRLDGKNYPVLDDKALDTAAGFLAQHKGKPCLLMRRAQLERVFGASVGQTLAELRSNGRLLAADGLQIQMRVRQNRVKDRVYCFVLGPLQPQA